MRVLLVDGYNVLRQVEPYRVIAETDVDAARTTLVSDVAAYAQGSWDATVVFDGGGNRHSDGRVHRMPGVDVIFSRFGIDADSVIESLARDARERGDEAVVVTSDAQLQWTVMGGAVTRLSAAGFGEEVRSNEGEWRDHAPSGSSKSTIEERTSGKIRERLWRWARGLD